MQVLSLQVCFEVPVADVQALHLDKLVYDEKKNVSGVESYASAEIAAQLFVQINLCNAL